MNENIEKIIIHHGDNNYTYYPVSSNGNFEPTTLEDSIFAAGNTAEVFLAVDDAGGRFLIKRYKARYNASEDTDNIVTDIKAAFNSQHSNYIMNELYVGFDDSNCKYKVFEYRAGSVLKKIEAGDESLFKKENREKLYGVLSMYCSFLESLRMFHKAGYLHCDVKLDNVFSFRLNEIIVSQPIDLDNVRTIENLVGDIQSGELNGVTAKFPTSINYYSLEDIITLCKLKNDEAELRRCICILDTTAAVKMLKVMLFGNFNFAIPERDREYFDQDEGLQTVLNSFFKKGILNDFVDRFATVDEMIEDMSDILKLVSNDLPKTIRNAKLIAIGKNDYIDYYRHIYREKHGLDDTDVVYIYELYDEFFNKNIFPYIQKTHLKSENSEKMIFTDFLSKSRDNYILTAEGGAGKTSSLFYAFLQNITDYNSDELYVYVPLSEYNSDKRSIKQFILKENGFDLENLILNNPNKITLFLDAFDEIYFMQKGDECEKKELTKKFFDSIKSIRNVRIIITSRMMPNDESGVVAANFKTASFLPLEEEQIKIFLNLDQAIYEEMRKNNSLQTLIKNPFMLAIYRQLDLNDSSKTKIQYAAELLEQYFWHMYKSKQANSGIKRVRKKYKDGIEFVSASAFFEGRHNLVLDDIEDVEEKIDGLECYYPIIEFYKNDDFWHIRFSHKIFEEYFIAKYLFLYFKDAFENGFEKGHMSVFKKRYESYQIPVFVSQMLKLYQKENANIYVKVQFEEFFQKVANNLSNMCNSHYCYEDRDNVVISSLLQIATFFVDGDLNKFNFGDFFLNKEIPGLTFFECNELQEIKFSNKMKYFNWNCVFNACKELKSITISSSLTNMGVAPFHRCSGITSIEVDSQNEVYCSIGNCLIDKKGKALILGCKNSIIPNDGSVIRIYHEAFYECIGLTNIIIPDGVADIGEYVFGGCSSLSSVAIPSSVKCIGDSAFYGCNSLTDVYYKGTLSEWSEITMGYYNDNLINATIYYYSENEPTDTEYKYWHYVDGVETVW